MAFFIFIIPLYSYSESEVDNFMEPRNRDCILEADDLTSGLLETIYAIQTAQQDNLIPITILSTFEAVLKQIHSLLGEVKGSMGN